MKRTIEEPAEESRKIMSETLDAVRKPPTTYRAVSGQEEAKPAAAGGSDAGSAGSSTASSSASAASSRASAAAKKAKRGSVDPAKIKVGFISLGCPKNQVDLERMLKLVEDAGFTLTAEETEADVVIVNTCAFIESAKRESIDSILDLGWLKKNRHLRSIIVTGCLAERYRDAIFEEMPEVNAALGVGSWNDIVRAIKETLAGEKFASYVEKNLAPMSGERILTTAPYSAYLKIAEGCDNCCSYCTIPAIRGRFRSRPMDELLEEARILLRSGVKEINLVAQDTTRYGLDLYGRYVLAELVQRLAVEVKAPWIRLLYCYPDKITDELIAVMRKNDNVLNYIDLPIQHINDEVLAKMNRHGGSAVIRDAIRRLREGVPGIVIRTTAISGFPGETVAQHTELCEFVQETRFEHFGVFPYSREEGTPAAKMPRQLSEEKKQQRADQLMELQYDIAAAWGEKRVGTVETMLLEGYDPVAEAFYGRTAADAPDIDGKVYIPGKPTLLEGKQPGDFLKVRITESMDYDLIAAPAE